MRFLLFVTSALILFTNQIIHAQDFEFKAQDSLRLRNIPELPENQIYNQNKLPLPVSVDNSTQPYWRGIFWQSGCSCGQASSEGYVYTYEINRARNLSANINQNLYPYSFTYNFLNIGNTVCGASFLESMDIIREAGIPNVATNNNVMTDPAMNKWLTGYDKYYAAMQNRANQVYAIHVGTPEGLDKLKQYLHNHLEGASSGGVAFFYANHVATPAIIPSGTPEAGKHIIKEFSNTSHSMTIVGYNDEVRFDFNNDGQFTNHLDITGDGIVDMRDWEIGALKIANSYSTVGGGPLNWADAGYCYVMYRILPYHNGPGIWDKAAYVVDVKENYSPLLTAKISLTYNYRDRIKVAMGVSANPNATQPSFIKDYPHFRFQGNNLSMQGGTSESDKTIEFGLDLTDLLNQVNSGQASKFFLIITENDPQGTGTGTINSFSLINYANGGTETTSQQSNVPITNNTTTLLSVQAGISFSDVQITTDTLPKANLNLPYSTQINAQGGNPPYQFHPMYNYKIIQTTNTFVPITGAVLSNTKKNATIPFQFPFYGSYYTVGTASQQGGLFFDFEDSNVPYSRDYSVLMRYFKSIAPFYGYHSAATVRYEGNASWAKFYWNATFNGTTLQYMVTLFPDGKIYIDYGNNSTPSNWEWQAGISKGDQISYQEFSFSGQSFPANTRIILEPRPFPYGLSLDENGLLSGVLTVPFTEDSVFIKVIDNNWLETSKGFAFSNSGIAFSNLQITTANNAIAEYGEDVWISLGITNVGEANISNLQISLIPGDPNYSIIDGSATISSLNTGQTQSLNNELQIKITGAISDNTMINLYLMANSASVSATDTFQLLVRAPHFVINNLNYTDGDNLFDPGDTGILSVDLKNIGGADAINMTAAFTAPLAYLTVNSILNNSIALVQKDSVWTVDLSVTASPLTPSGVLVNLPAILSGFAGFSENVDITVGIGQQTENWEGTDTLNLPWTYYGDSLWFEDTAFVYEGMKALRSGFITHDQSCTFSVMGTVATPGMLSFYKKVSSETNYDFLKFYIDSVEVGRWSGNQDWLQVSFYVPAGLHIYEWKYEKDYSVNTGLDAAFVDLIVFPASDFSPPELSIFDSIIEIELIPDTLSTYSFRITNSGAGLLAFQSFIDNASLNSGNKNPDKFPAIKSIEGSSLTASLSDINTGMPFSMELALFNGTSDSEWIEGLTINIPYGVQLDSVTNFIGGSGGELEWNGSLGNGSDVFWFGEDTATGYGLLRAGESAYAQLWLSIDTGFSNDIILYYTIHGEVYAAAPHEISDVLVLNNLGQNTTWLTLSEENGSLFKDEDGFIHMNFNTYSIPIGEYSCLMTIHSNADTAEVVVKLKVANPVDPIGIAEHSNEISIYPNPARNEVYIQLENSELAKVDLYSPLGALISTHEMQNHLRLNLGSLSAGYYNLIISGKNYRVVKKLMILGDL